MKTEESDQRYRELQQDLIHTLSTDQLQDLEQEIPMAAEQAMRGLRKAFLILGGGGMALAILALQVEDRRVIWFLICAATAIYLLIEDLHGFRWALKFTNSKGEQFCLPLWINADDDARRLRSWRETVGQPCEVEAVTLGVMESMGVKHQAKKVISSAVTAVLVWLVIGFLIGVHGRGSDKGGVEIGMILFVYIICVILKFWNCWVAMRSEPDLYGEGYKEVISTLDARGVTHGTRRQRH